MSNPLIVGRREKATALREEAEKLEKTAKQNFDRWSALRGQASSKIAEAERLEVAAEMTEQAGEIAAGLRPIPRDDSSDVAA